MPPVLLSLFNSQPAASSTNPVTSARKPRAYKNTTQPKPRSPLFGAIAQAEVDALRARLHSGQGKPSYADYIDAAENYLLPFFGSRRIDELTPELMDAFDSWRASRLGRVPKQSTQRNHASAFARVVNRLRREGLWDERRLSHNTPPPQTLSYP